MPKKKPKLKRTLGLFETTSYGVGLILGAGIYVLLGRGASIAGNSIWLAFIFASIIAAFTGLSYCELSSKFPKESSEYLYTKKAFNSKSFSFITGWILVFAGAVSATAVSLGFSEYFAKLFSINFVFLPLIAGILLIILSLINFWGIKESIRINIIATFIEMGGLLIIIFIGIPHLGSVDYFSTPIGPAFSNIGVLMSAAALIFFAYIGFDEMPKIIEETKKGYKTIPKALIYAVIISTTLYIIVAISAVSVVPWNELKHAPLTQVVETAWGIKGVILMSIIALFATFNTALAILIGFSRLLYGMACSSCLPDKLAKIHPKTQTPYYAIFTIMFFSLFFLILGDISTLASITDLGIFLVFFVTNSSLIYLRYKDHKAKTKPTNRFRVPLNIGWFPVTALIGLVSVTTLLFHFEPIIYLYELGIIVIGIILYFIFNKTTSFSQS